MKIICVVGARPNFMKIAPIIEQFKLQGIRKPSEYLLVHTGQHYDKNMSEDFFHDLELPEPDMYLGVGSGTPVEQIARIMIEFERVCQMVKPDLVIVVGDVNSTLACSLVAAKLQIAVAHVEAGLRSYDRTMPEEINRVLTDAISDYLFTSCEDAFENLKREGIPDEKIHFVGNVMIDTLLKFRQVAEKSDVIKRLGICNNYALLTLHRASNVDAEDDLRNILGALKEVSNKIPIIFPVHPRTYKSIYTYGLLKLFQKLPLNNVKDISNDIYLTDPLGYLDFLKLMAGAKLVFTDSGGIQEETTILGVPCLTLRENTERPITIKEGTNKLVGRNAEKIVNDSMKALNGSAKIISFPKLWDGRAAERIVNILLAGC